MPKKPKGYEKRAPKREKIAKEVSQMGLLKELKKDVSEIKRKIKSVK